MIDVRIQQSIGDREYEVVERKGMGHPDTLCDALSEIGCHVLCKHYEKIYSVILPHKLDKVMIAGGGSNPQFGGGALLQPIRIIIRGAGTTEVKDGAKTYREQPFKIIVQSMKQWIASNFPMIDVNKNILFENRMRGGMADLTLIDRSQRLASTSEDTSMGVGYAPLSATEQLVLRIEQELNSTKCKTKFPAIGREIKIMAYRRHNKVSLIIAAAMISSLVPDLATYNHLKDTVKKKAKLISHALGLDCDILVNQFDELPLEFRMRSHTGTYGRFHPSVYMLVTGTHGEKGSGVTGRGNRTNGLITPMKPMTIEAPAGKMPSHPGKLYNVAAFKIANKLVEIKGIREAEVYLISKIGSEIWQPEEVIIHITTEESKTKLEKKARMVVEAEISKLKSLADELIEGHIKVY